MDLILSLFLLCIPVSTTDIEVKYQETIKIQSEKYESLKEKYANLLEEAVFERRKNECLLAATSPFDSDKGIDEYTQCISEENLITYRDNYFPEYEIHPK